MVNISNFVLITLLTQFILQVLFVGILFVELFNDKRKNKSSVIWFLAATLFWISFIILGEIMLFSNGFSFILSIFSILFLAVALAIYMIIVVRRFSIMNKIITFPVGIVATAILIIALINRHPFDPISILPVTLSIFFVSIMWTFVFLDVFIKESSGYKVNATKKYRKMDWVFIILGLLIGAIVAGLLAFVFFYSGYEIWEELIA